MDYNGGQMAYEPEIIERADHLRVVSRGDLEVDGGRLLFDALIQRVGRTGVTRILVDNRQARAPMAATEKAMLGIGVEEPYRRHLAAGGEPLRAAFLVPSDWLLPFRPLADLLNGMGLETATFSDENELRDWLGIDEV
jgi:hypothetical protein